MSKDFEQAFQLFYESQLRTASGRRLEMLRKDLTGEKKMLREAIWPVFKSFAGFTLEYEVKSISGVSIFIDAFYDPLRAAFESDGYVAHAENISRERFSFERMRMRTFALNGYKYFPFSWDELDKNPEICRRSVYELLGRYTGADERAMRELTVYEREVLRYALRLNRPFGLSDARYCLQTADKAARYVLKSLMEKRLLRSKGQGKEKIRLYELEERARDYML